MVQIDSAYIRIDWLSFTVPNDDGVNEEHLLNYLYDIFASEGAHNIGFSFTPSWKAWEVIPHHKPYKIAFRSRDIQGLVVMYSEKRPEILIECQGAFCEMFAWTVERLAFIFQRSVTRVDVAVDAWTDTTPIEAWGGVANKTYSVNQSKDGQTVYVGSPKSEKMMRVYRYNAPHPRSHLLRSEVVFRRGWAKKLASALSDETALIQFVGAFWKQNDAVWWVKFVLPLFEGGERSDLVAQPARRGSDKTNASTLAWLHSQVRPALKRAVKSGGSLDEILEALGLYWSSETSISVR